MSICYLRFSAEMAGSLPLINAFLYLARMLNKECYKIILILWRRSFIML